MILRKVLPLKFLYLILMFFYKPRQNFYSHLWFVGEFSVKFENKEMFRMMHYGYQIENQLFWDGIFGWEPKSTYLWAQLCKKSNVIIDIGANTGVYSLIAKSINPSADVYAFEPVERVYDKLIKNMYINNFNVQCINKAVSRIDGEAIIYDPVDNEHIYSVTINKNIDHPDSCVKPVTVKTITLDTFIVDAGINKVDLIKIDVETHEPEVLMGFQKFINIHQPTMLIEILSDSIALSLEELLSGVEYLFFNVDDRIGGRIKRVDRLSKSDKYNYLICKEDVAGELGLL